MKRLFVVLSIGVTFLFDGCAQAQSNSLEKYPHLCKPSERVAFTCIAGAKNISLCVKEWPKLQILDRRCSIESPENSSKNGTPRDCRKSFKDWDKGQMTYRFGISENNGSHINVEMEYPKKELPLKVAFGAAQISILGKSSLAKNLNPSELENERKIQENNFVKQTGIELIPGIYTEIWFSSGKYRYTIFSQGVFNPIDKGYSGAGVVVEKSGERIGSFTCDDPEWALYGEYYHPDAYRKSFASYLDDINYLFHGKGKFKNESDGFRAISPLNDVRRVSRILN
jgi:hypothetical protein